MSNIDNISHSLESKIHKILHKSEFLKTSNLKLTEDLEISKQKIQEQQNMIAEWESKYETLKIANTILGSNDYKKEAKLKINVLIREIDHCIAKLKN